MPSSTGNSPAHLWRPNLNEYEPTIKTACDLAMRFAAVVRTNPDRGYWLTLSGVTGCGKTMIAEQLFAECRKWNPADRVGAWTTGTGVFQESRRRPVSLWMAATEFADRCKRDFSYPESLEKEFLIAIDDIGTARDKTEFVAEALYRLANVRLNRWTIFTTNFSLGEVASNVDERVASRMIRDANTFHRIKAGEFALRKKP